MTTGTLRLILIDDDEDVFVLVRDFLAETAPDWTVDWASTYEAGIEGLTSGRYDAALLDYHLGAHTGVDLLANVRTIGDLPPIVLLTGQGDRAIDLAAMATGAADYLDKGVLSPALLERTVRHAMEREAAIVALRASEAKYHGLFERAGDAVLIADDTGCYVDANPAACALLGVSREQVIGRSLADFVVGSAEMPDFAAAWDAFLAAGEMRGEVRIRRPDGSIRDAEFLATAHFTPGRHLSVLRDDTDRLAAQAALVEALAALRLSEGRFRSALDGVGLHAAILDPEGRILFINQHFLARTGWQEADLIGADCFQYLSPESGPDASRDGFKASVVAGSILGHVENEWRTNGGGPVRISWTNSAIRDDAGTIVAVAVVGEDVTARRAAEARQAVLVAAMDQAAESIMVTDLVGMVIYANPAFERTSGVRVADIIGRDPHSVFKGTGAAAAYPRIGRRLKAGKTWSGEWLLTRHDGSSYREEVTVAPVRDATGSVVHFVRVARDVTHLHQIQESLESTTRDRAAFANALARLRQRASPEETSQDIADALMEVPGIDIAGLLSFEESGDVRVLAVIAPDGHPFKVGRAIHAGPARRLREQASAGAWSERLDADDVGGTGPNVWAALHLQGIAYAPIGSDEGLVGIVVLGTTDRAVAARIQDQVPIAIEFAAAARSLIAEPLLTRRRITATRARIEAVMLADAFAPVFQPIVNLATGAPIGFEALTRFDDGTRPDLVFAEAGIAGVGLDLEAATLGRTLTESLNLPTGTWLSVNVSAALVLDGDRLAAILADRSRPIVLEITEHDSITDYAAVRAAIALLGPDVRIAVDDAGAGVANFSHIVELRPDFVKIDVSLVRGVNHDLTRQALIVGLRHFAQATNGWVIAEGVETEAERQTLIGLDLELGQGYLSGRPASVEVWATPTIGVVPPVRPAGRLRRPKRPSRPATIVPTLRS